MRVVFEELPFSTYEVPAGWGRKHGWPVEAPERRHVESGRKLGPHRRLKDGRNRAEDVFIGIGALSASVRKYIRAEVSLRAIQLVSRRFRRLCRTDFKMIGSTESPRHPFLPARRPIPSASSQLGSFEGVDSESRWYVVALKKSGSESGWSSSPARLKRGTGSAPNIR